ncbi:MAG: hypothetical protein GTN76_15795 [Candidatus Aenigmarchaeota archaeon]|nr:hypothetical protein [Candidatus Aenigmarchaeota archaeon]
MPLPGFKKKYIIEGVEEVFDEFDEFEHENPIEPFTVEAASLKSAKTIGEKILQQKINLDRFKRGYVSTSENSAGQWGMYVASVKRILDEKGKVLYDCKKVDK